MPILREPAVPLGYQRFRDPPRFRRAFGAMVMTFGLLMATMALVALARR